MGSAIYMSSGEHLATVTLIKTCTVQDLSHALLRAAAIKGTLTLLHNGHPLQCRQKLEAAGLNNHVQLHAIVQDFVLAVLTFFDDGMSSDDSTAPEGPGGRLDL